MHVSGHPQKRNDQNKARKGRSFYNHPTFQRRAGLTARMVFPIQQRHQNVHPCQTAQHQSSVKRKTRRGNRNSAPNLNIGETFGKIIAGTGVSSNKLAVQQWGKWLQPHCWAPQLKNLACWSKPSHLKNTDRVSTLTEERLYRIKLTNSAERKNADYLQMDWDLRTLQQTQNSR